MSLPDFSIRRPVAATMLFVALAVLGTVSILRLPVDLLPDVSFPTLAVSTSYPDAGPVEVERYVTVPVEEGLSRIPGVRSVTSRSRQGLSIVRLAFDWGTEMEPTTLRVRERLDEVRGQLPRSAGRPTILRTDPNSQPVLTLAVTGGDLLQLRNLAETVFKRRLEQMDGVAMAAVTGGPEREVQVVVDPERLAAYGLRMEDLRTALDRANYSAPGGRIRRGRFYYTLRTLGEFESLEDLRQVVLRPDPDRSGSRSPADGRGGSVRLGDVAEVREGTARRESLARYDGEPAVGIEVYKEAGSNTVRVDDRVEETLTALRAEFPDVTVRRASSQARFIRDAIANVAQALVLGGLLAFLVLFLFLRDPRYPVAVGLSIPVSVLTAFALFYFFDVSLNVMSLGGLALGVGMLVDNSIVVLENIFRHREEGRGGDASASLGAREVAAAITASTLTTIAVFGPVLYVRGVAGALFEDLSLSVAFSLLASLLVALVLLPGLAARLGRSRRAGRAGRGRGGEEPTSGPSVGPGAGATGPEGEGQRGRLAGLWYRAGRIARRWRAAARGLLRETTRSVALTAREVAGAAGRLLSRVFAPPLDAFQRGFRRFAGRYESALLWSLDHRWTVLGVAAATLAGAALLGAGLPRSLMPPVDEGRFRVRVSLPVGTPLRETSDVARRLERLAAGMEGVASIYTRVGRTRGGELAGVDPGGLHTAVLEVQLAEDAEPARVVAEGLRRRARRAGIDPSRLATETGRSTSLGQALAATEADLAVRIQGEELEALFAVADSVRRRLRGSRFLSDVRVDQERTRPVLTVDVDRTAVASHGLEVQAVADAMEFYLQGRRTARPFTEFSRRIGIEVGLPRARRSDLGAVLDLPLEGVPLRELVRVEQGRGPVEIRRSGQARTVRVLASVEGAGLGEAVEAVEARLSDLLVPRGVRLRAGGANEEMQASFRSLLFALGLALFLVYLILAGQFESLRQPAVILGAVPLAAIGAVLALWLTGGGVNVMSGIGVVVLVGIVVNDAIIKVDFINQRRAAGLGLRRAVLEAGRLRLRPIVMTTVTTVFGLLPLALGWGAGADLRAPLAVAVIGGLLSATFLTLLVVPVLYSVVAGEGPVGPAARGEGPLAPAGRQVGAAGRTGSRSS